MRVELFIDPVSGWSWWTPALLVEEEPRADQERTEARQGSAGQGLRLRLLGRVGAWFGVCQQSPSGAWQRIHVARRHPGEPAAQGSTASSGAGGAGDRPSSRPPVEPGPGM